MALAPVAPLAAVALTYGRHAEPAGELALATPTAGLRVVAARAVLVALPAVPVGVGVALLLGLPTPVAFGWLLPGAALAVAGGPGRHDPAGSLGRRRVPGRRSGPWPSRGPPRRAGVPADVVTHLVASAPIQLTALVVALAAIALTIARRDTVAYRRTA